MDEILSAFIAECHENIEKLDNELVLLEKHPEGPQVQRSLGHIFRTVHTIKGSCGWLGLSKLESVVHDGEDLLVALREGRVPVTTAVVSVLLEMFDAVREILACIAATEQEGDVDYSALILRLKQLQEAEVQAEAAPAAAISTQAADRNADRNADQSAAPAPAPAGGAAEAQSPASVQSKAPTGNGHKAQPAPAAAQAAPPVPAAQPSQPQAAARPQPGPASGPSSTPTSTPGSTPGAAKTAGESIRVDVKILDTLMNLVGELVLTRNQILQYGQSRQDAQLNTTTQRLNLITSELQASVMKTRMQVIGTIWNKFPRVARDLALECGKDVELVMEGQETELDRTLIEAIKDPLTHLVRNAVDHGIEPPAARLAAGKPAKGRISLRAYHEGGQVIIAISDDGRGLNPDKVREKALQKGLLTPSEAAQLGERSLLNLIFLPGFSTAEQVTNISGRGVGMDVVKHNIEAIGGSIDLASGLGTGTTVKIKIPLTLAIIPALLVECQGESFAIPQVNVSELILLEGAQARDAVELIHETPVYRLRGKLLPLMALSETLQLGESFAELRQGLHSGGDEARLSIVVLQAEDQAVGLIVDRIKDTAEIVVKPLSKQLKTLSTYAGATILGDGHIALILDVLGLTRQASMLAAAQRQSINTETALSVEQGQRQSMLLFQTLDRIKMALPMELVNRLETFAIDQVEYSGDTRVIQYWDQILPLVDLDEVLPRPSRGGEARAVRDTKYLQVVVCKDQERYAGIVVDKILDIIEAEPDYVLQQNLKREGVMGTLILQGAVTELLDFRGVTRKQLPSFFEADAPLAWAPAAQAAEPDAERIEVSLA